MTEINHDQRPKKHSQNKSKFAALMGLAALWTPFNRRLVLAGVRTNSADGTSVIARTSHDKVCAPRDGWAPTFAYTGIDIEGIKDPRTST